MRRPEEALRVLERLSRENRARLDRRGQLEKDRRSSEVVRGDKSQRAANTSRSMRLA